jgi:hypothetical protein
MKKQLILLLSCMTLSACSNFNENRADEFQSLSQLQQAHYWQAKKVSALTKRVKGFGLRLYTQGDENQIIIPAGVLFNSDTPQFHGNSTMFKTIADLINAQSTASVQVLAYANNSQSAQRNFSLTQSWADSVVDALRTQGLQTGLLSAQGHGDCDNIGTTDGLTNRIEIHYRVGHEN